MTKRLTRVEMRMLQLFSDGQPHSLDELRQCLADAEYGSNKTVYAHIHNLKTKLPPGEVIVCRNMGCRRTRYQHVRLLLSPSDLPRISTT